MAVDRVSHQLNSRLAWASGSRQAKLREHVCLRERIREVTGTQVLACSHLQQVAWRLADARRELRRRGLLVPNEEESLLFPPPPPSTGTPASAPPWDRAAWFAEVSRQEAEKTLADKPVGTFLVRPSAIPNRCALSLA